MQIILRYSLFKYAMNQKLTDIAKAVACCVLFTALLAVVAPLKSMLPPQYERYVYGVIGTLVAFAVVAMFVKIQKTDRAAIGLQWCPSTIKNFIAGFLSGVVLSGAMLFVVVYFNGLQLEKTNASLLTFLGWAMSLLLLSFMEEVGFRTYAFTTLNKAAGPWVAQVIIAVLFAFYHVAGGQPVVSALLGPGTWAFIFGYAVLRSGGIAMATGIHFAANLVQAAISQKKDYTGLWKIQAPQEITAAMQSRIDTTGFILQLSLLIIGIILTWIVVRKKMPVQEL